DTNSQLVQLRQATWSPAQSSFTLTTLSTSSDYPFGFEDATGSLWLAYLQNAAVVAGRRSDLTGQWSPPRDIAGPGTFVTPAVVATPTGDTWLVYDVLGNPDIISYKRFFTAI